MTRAFTISVLLAILIGALASPPPAWADACAELSNGVKCQGADYVYIQFYDGSGYYSGGGCTMEWNSDGYIGMRMGSC